MTDAFKYICWTKPEDPGSYLTVHEFEGPNKTTAYLTYDDLSEEWSAELELDDTVIIKLDSKVVAQLIALLSAPKSEPKRDLTYWLETIRIYQGELWTVSDENGAIAYFENETDADRYRLDVINRRMHP